MSETRPVLIVGAGPTGMTAAMELSRFGIPVRLVDRYGSPPDTSRALAVQSRTLELFAQRGLTDEMIRLGNKGHATTLYGRGKALGTVDLRRIQSRFNYVLLLAQSETERLLREKLEQQGVVIERETELAAFAQGEGRSGDSGVRAVLRRPGGVLEEVEAAYLIDCEGAHSTVRHTLGLPFRGRSLQHTYALADLHVDGDLPEDELSIFVSDSGLLAAFPMGNRRFRVIATEKGAAAGNQPDPDLAHMQALWDRGAHLSATFRDLVWSSRFRINSRALDQLRDRSVFFGGDSAHVHSPAGGQGMNTGIQDMINLGWKLAMVYRCVASPKLLDTYESERLPIIRALVATTERATDLFDSNSTLTRTLLEYALPVALSMGAVQNQGAGIVSETQGNYRPSALTLRGQGSGEVHAGDRVPDLSVQTEGGSQTLLTLLDPSRFTLLSLDGAPMSVTFAGCAKDWKLERITVPTGQDDARRFLSAFGDAKWMLVRPDGYLVGVSKAGDTGLWEPWCREWFPGTE